MFLFCLVFAMSICASVYICFVVTCWERAHRGLPVGFLLLQYSVLFSVESLILLYLLVISFFICSRR